jgi:hypothetical protein
LGSVLATAPADPNDKVDPREIRRASKEGLEIGADFYNPKVGEVFKAVHEMCEMYEAWEGRVGEITARSSRVKEKVRIDGKL